MNWAKYFFHRAAFCASDCGKLTGFFCTLESKKIYRKQDSCPYAVSNSFRIKLNIAIVIEYLDSLLVTISRQGNVYD